MDAYIAGMLYGDGTKFLGKNRAYAVTVDQHIKNKDISEFLKKKLKQSDLNVHDYNFKFGKTRMRRIMVYSKKLFMEFEEMRKSSVKFFKNLSRKDKAKFIGGFFDAEGTVTDRLVVYNQDLKLLKAIQKFLKQKKILSYVYRFGKVYGVQIYRKDDVKKFRKLISCVKLNRSVSASYQT